MNLYLSGHAPHIKGSAALFLRAAVLLSRDGHEIYPTPEQVTALDTRSLVADTFEEAPTYDPRDELGQSLTWICAKADAVLVLPSWRDTLRGRGRAEVATAQALRIPVHTVASYLLHGDRAEQLNG